MTATTDSPSLIQQPRRICLFGTSANPPTGDRGHVGIVRSLSKLATTDDAVAFDEIRVIPVYSHPFPEKRDLLAPFEHRKRMCELAFQGIPNVTVSDAEFQMYKRRESQQQQQQQNIPSDKAINPVKNIIIGTADLLEYFLDPSQQEDQPQKHKEEFTLCLGSDTFLDLMRGRWRRSSDITKIVQGRFVVLHRLSSTAMSGVQGGEESPKANLNASTTTASTAQQQQYQQQTDLLEKIQEINQTFAATSQTQAARLLHVPDLGAVSSTLVRSYRPKITDEDDQDKGLLNLVPLPVASYMRDHRLYGFAVNDYD